MTLGTSLLQQLRQLPHSLPCLLAGHVKDPELTVLVQGQLFTGGWLIIWLENLIVKFLEYYHDLMAKIWLHV